MNWLAHERFAVWGLGVSGIASANLLARRGKKVLASDTRPLDALGGVRSQLHPDVELVGGGNAAGDAQVVIASPGLKPSLPVFADLAIPVVSEIELALDASACRFVGITGTDGKTTTTALAAHMFEVAGLPTVAAGNIGTPLCDVVEGFGPDGVVVAEVSAFQLWSTHHFRTSAAAFTNIAEDHLDYFTSFDAYVEAKRRLIAFARHDDLGVFNLEDPVIRSWIGGFSGDIATYGLEPANGNHHWCDGKTLYLASGAEVPLEACSLKGRHNWLNMMASAHLAARMGVSDAALVEALATFKPLAHRVEPVLQVGGVWFYDDSKATNAHAAMAGIKSLSGDLVVIAGGVDKGLDLAPFASLLVERAKAVVVIGEIADRLTRALHEAGHKHVEYAESMESAVQTAAQRAGGRGTVLLSPACSSFDMFTSYAHRGDVFQAAARALG